MNVVTKTSVSTVDTFLLKHIVCLFLKENERDRNILASVESGGGNVPQN